MVDLVDGQASHHRLGTPGKLDRLPHMVHTVLSNLPIDVVDHEQQVLVVPVEFG